MKAVHDEPGWAMSAIQPIPTPNRIRPDMRMNFPPILSVSGRPRSRNIETSEAGAMVSPAFSAENPSTDCR